MFRCTQCQMSSLPKTKPIVVPAETRSQRYDYDDGEGHPAVSFGTETVREAWLCPACAGIPIPVQPAADISASVGLGLAMQAHARKCNKKLEDCVMCQRNVQTYRSVSAPAINAVLCERQASAGRLRVADLVMTSLMRRAKEQTKDGVQGRRAKADFAAAFSVLGGYERRGGVL